MANESDSRMSGSMERGQPAGTDQARMKTGYGRESVGRPDETGIRSGDQNETSRQQAAETDQGPPSRQTSTPPDMSGQV